MPVPTPLDDVARTSDDAAVLTRFDAATLTALKTLSAAFAVVAVPHITESTTVLQASLASVVLVLGALMFLALRLRASNIIARSLRGRVRGAAMAFVIVEAAALILYSASADSEAASVFGMLVPVAVILMRLRAAEHVLLHTLLAAVFAVIVLSVPLTAKHAAEMIASVIAMNVVALTVALFVSQRQRRAIIREWTERRASAREQIRMRDELQYARELQLSMLPESAPAVDWVEISSASVPATEVGGDYYDYFVDGDCVTLVCLDVAGHGMASGLVLSSVRGALSVMRDVRDPVVLLQRLHELVSRNTRRRMLVTISIVVLDRASRRAVVASAGHPPVMVRRTDGSVDTLELHSPPLGVHLPIAIREQECTFSPGDVFVLHSDGVYEARNVNGATYGLDRLREVLSENGEDSAETLRDAILSDVAAFRGTEEQHDDISVVVCRVV